MISAVIYMSPCRLWHLCNLPCVFRLISIARYASNLHKTAFEGHAAYGTSLTYVGNWNPWAFYLCASELAVNSCCCPNKIKHALAICEHDSASPALHPKQWADKIVPSFSEMTQMFTKGSFIRCECRTRALTTYLLAITLPTTNSDPFD